MKAILGLILIIVSILLIIVSILFSIWLCLWVMLYGGIMQAIENWGVDNSVVVWGIIRAVFFHVGMIPAYFGIVIGTIFLTEN